MQRLLLAGLCGLLVPACSTTTPDDEWVEAHWPPQAWHEAPHARVEKAPAPEGWDDLLALSSSPDEGAVGAMAERLSDADPALRARAAFTLGVSGRSEALEPLRGALADEAPEVRAAAVDALTRVLAGEAPEGPDVERLRAALGDADARVRGAAAVALVRLPAEALVFEGPSDGAPRTTELGNALYELARQDPDAGVRWRALWAFDRAALDGHGVRLMIERATDPEATPLERVFAARGTASLMEVLRDSPAERDGEPTWRTRGRLALEGALLDPDWRVAFEAVRGLRTLTDEASIPALVEATRHPSFHVRSAAVLALGDYEELKERTAVWAVSARMDASPTVRVAQLITVARLYGDEVDGRVAEAATSADPVMRIGAARAATVLPAGQALPLLTALSHDADPAVVGAAIEALAGLLPDDDLDGAASARLRELVASPDNGVRLSAVLALEGHWTPDDLPLLRDALEAEGDIGSEVRFNTLRALRSQHTNGMPNPDVVGLLVEALGDPDGYVAGVAADELRRLGMDHGTPEARTPERLRHDPDAYGPEGAPWVQFDTPHGTLTFALYPDEAPTHVRNFVERVRSGYYDGLDFHRVVSDFVVQGGCYRGDGNGAGTWRGATDALPAEFGPTPYLRGALGMPRNEDPNSGGSQIFVTHLPTPHLDGRYTLFGQLVDGFDALDAIEVGDRILRTRLVERDGSGTP